MEFSESKGIYQQIADQLCEEIIQGKWEKEARIPAIRDMAVQSGVNPNTVTRSYQYLMEKNIIYNQRGVGYFVSSQAENIILDEGRRHFIEKELPRFFRTMELLKIPMSKVEEFYQSFQGGTK